MRNNQGNLGPSIYSAAHSVSLFFNDFKLFTEGTELKFNYNFIPTEIESIDNRIYGFRREELAVIGGDRGMGKTVFVLSIAYEMCLKHKIKVMYFSLNESASQIGERILKIHLETKSKKDGNTNDHILSYTNDDILKDLSQLNELKELLSLNLFVDDEQISKPIDLISRIRYSHERFKISVFIIDDLQQVLDEKSSKDEVNCFLKHLKNIALELKCVVILTSQLSRKIEKRKNRLPKIKDLQEFGNVKKYADVIGFVFRPEYYGFMQDKKGRCNAGIFYLIVKKWWNKKRNMKIRLRFDLSYMKIKELTYLVFEDQEIQK